MATQTGEAIYWILRKAYEEYEEATGYDISSYLPVVQFTGGDYTLNWLETEAQKKEWVRQEDGSVALVHGDKNVADVWDFGLPGSLLRSQLGVRETTRHLLQRYLNLHVSGELGDEKNTLLDPDGRDKTIAGLGADPCILKLNRPTTEFDTPSITLRPFKSYFRNMGDRKSGRLGNEYMDSFFFKNEDGFINQTLGVLKGFINLFNFCGKEAEGKPKNTITPIEDFVYNPLNPDDSNKFIVPHIAQHDGDSQTVTAEKDGSFQNTKRYLAEAYLPNLVEETNPVVRSLMVNIDDGPNLKSNSSAVIKFESKVPTEASLIALGRNKLIKSMIFLNDSLSFTIKGSTHRQSGNFFGVDLMGGSDPNDENLNRLLGVWWAANVTHQIDFRDKTYVNEITGVKFYRYRAPQDALKGVDDVTPEYISPDFTTATDALLG